MASPKIRPGDRILSEDGNTIWVATKNKPINCGGTIYNYRLKEQGGSRRTVTPAAFSSVRLVHNNRVFKCSELPALI